MFHADFRFLSKSKQKVFKQSFNLKGAQYQSLPVPNDQLKKRKKKLYLIHWFFPKSCLKFTNFDENSTEFQHFLRKTIKTQKAKICEILKFPEISQRKLSIFPKMIFQKLEKKLELEQNPF